MRPANTAVVAPALKIRHKLAPMSKPKRRRAGIARTTIAQREDRFIEAYLADPQRNAAAAARKAGYSPRSSTTQASILMARPRVKEALQRRHQEAMTKARITVDEVHADLKAAYTADYRDFYRPDGTFKLPHELTKEQMWQIEGLEVEEVFKVEGKKGKGQKRTLYAVNVVKVKFAKRLAVRDQGMRHLGLYAKDNPSVADPDETAALVRERIKQMRGATE